MTISILEGNPSWILITQFLEKALYQRRPCKVYEIIIRFDLKMNTFITELELLS